MTTLLLIEIFQDQLMYSTNFSPPCIVFTMLLCLDFYVLDLHVYLTHERHQIPYDKPHRLGDDGNVHPLLLAP
jgi:hypothetical protein